VVTVLLGAPPEGVRLDDDERRAIEVLAASGLVPPLRLATSEPAEVVDVPQIRRLGRAAG
jgi:hypothetical protein